MLAAQGVTMAVDEKRMRGRWGLRACRGYGPLPPLPLDRGGIIHQRCRLRSDRQRPGDALLRPGTHRRDQEGRRAVERRRADRDGAPPLLKDLRLLGDAQRWGCCSRSGATGQISTPPFVELHQRPGARRGQPLGRPPARKCDRVGGRVRPAGWPYRGTRPGGTRGRGRPGRRVLQSRLRGRGSRAASANARTHRRTRQGRRPAATSPG
jgi:hypothetical protein